MVPFTRGSTKIFLPIASPTALITPSISASVKLSEMSDDCAVLAGAATGALCAALVTHSKTMLTAHINLICFFMITNPNNAGA